MRHELGRLEAQAAGGRRGRRDRQARPGLPPRHFEEESEGIHDGALGLVRQRRAPEVQPARHRSLRRRPRRQDRSEQDARRKVIPTLNSQPSTLN